MILVCPHCKAKRRTRVDGTMGRHTFGRERNRDRGQCPGTYQPAITQEQADAQLKAHVAELIANYEARLVAPSDPSA